MFIMMTIIIHRLKPKRRSTSSFKSN